MGTTKFTPRYTDIDGIYQNPSAKLTGAAKIICVGDLMGEPKMQEAAYFEGEFDFRKSFKYVRPIFETADLVLGNLETVISTSAPYSMDVHEIEEFNRITYLCNSPVEYLDALRYSGFDLFPMSNNHNIDYGIDGVKDTLSKLSEYGFGYTGVFLPEHKKRHLLVNVNGIKLGILSYSTWFNKRENYLTKDEQDITLNTFTAERAERDIASARADGAEFVLIYMHWGEESEYKHEVGAKQKIRAQELADAGADYIVGSHPHAIQEYDVIRSADGRDVPVMYSLGNFMTSDGNFITRKNIILALSLQKENECVKIIDEYYIPCYVANTYKGVRYPIIPTISEVNGGLNDEFLRKANTLALEKIGGKLRPLSFEGDNKTENALNELLSYPLSKANITELRDKDRVLMRTLTILQVGYGYTIAQWLQDFGYRSVSIVVEPLEEIHYTDLLEAVLLPFKMNKSIVIKNYFSTSRKIQIKRTFYTIFGQETYQPIRLSKIDPDDAVIYVSPIENADMRTNIEKTGAEFFTLRGLLRCALNYISTEEPILRLLAENPGVKAMKLCIPSIRQDKSDDAKELITKGIRVRTNNVALKGHDLNAELLCSYIKEDTRFTVEDWCEMALLDHVPDAYIDENGLRRFKDRSGKCVNVVNGHRVTMFQPEVYDNKIYIFGGCKIFGIYCADDLTLQSQMQRLLGDKKYSDKVYRVENYGHFFDGQFRDLSRVINSIKPKKDDIIILASDKSLYYEEEQWNSKYAMFPMLDLTECTLPSDYGQLFCDGNSLQGHPSPNLHRFIAEKTIDYLIENEFFANLPTEYQYKTRQIPLFGLQLDAGAESNISVDFKDKLSTYKNELRQIQHQSIGRIGAVVVNCNPFTLGHRYLIEYAANRVKHLFVFAVEADLSVFPFKDRLELIKQGTADLTNVTVLPSGEFIISALTFSDYFNKSSIQDQTIDPSMDVEVFAKEIAPVLGISVRFVGDEPLDKITMQYNDTMKQILPGYGIDVDIIPRLEESGGVISASRVRRLLEANDFSEIEKLVPETTLRYLREDFDSERLSLDF